MAVTKKTPNKKSGNSSSKANSSTASGTPNSGSATETKKSYTKYAQYQNPSSVNFDSNAWKQSYIDQMVSELTSNYNTDKANLDKTYNTNITNYNNQLKDTNMSYDANIQALQRQKYDDTQQAKNEAFSRGLGFGGLGQAIEQTARNNANNKIADTQNERSRAINDINTLINQVKYNYGVDSDVLLKNFNADKLKYMSTAEIQALEKQLQVDIHNNDWANKFLQDANNRKFTSSENDKKYKWQSEENRLNRDWESEEAQKNRDAQTALEKLQASLGKYSSSGSYSYGSSYGSGSSSKLTKDQEYTLAKNYLAEHGVGKNDTVTEALYSFLRGKISSDELWSTIDTVINGSGTGGGGTANKGSGAGRRTSSDSFWSKFVKDGSDPIPFGHGLNAKVPYSKRK